MAERTQKITLATVLVTVWWVGHPSHVTAQLGGFGEALNGAFDAAGKKIEEASEASEPTGSEGQDAPARMDQAKAPTSQDPDARLAQRRQQAAQDVINLLHAIAETPTGSERAILTERLQALLSETDNSALLDYAATTLDALATKDKSLQALSESARMYERIVLDQKLRKRLTKLADQIDAGKTSRKPIGVRQALVLLREAALTVALQRLTELNRLKRSKDGTIPKDSYLTMSPAKAMDRLREINRTLASLRRQRIVLGRAVPVVPSRYNSNMRRIARLEKERDRLLTISGVANNEKYRAAALDDFEKRAKRIAKLRAERDAAKLAYDQAEARLSERQSTVLPLGMPDQSLRELRNDRDRREMEAMVKRDEAKSIYKRAEAEFERELDEVSFFKTQMSEGGEMFWERLIQSKTAAERQVDLNIAIRQAEKSLKGQIAHIGEMQTSEELLELAGPNYVKLQAMASRLGGAAIANQMGSDKVGVSQATRLVKVAQSEFATREAYTAYYDAMGDAGLMAISAIGVVIPPVGIAGSAVQVMRSHGKLRAAYTNVEQAQRTSEVGFGSRSAVQNATKNLNDAKTAFAVDSVFMAADIGFTAVAKTLARAKTTQRVLTELQEGVAYEARIVAQRGVTDLNAAVKAKGIGQGGNAILVDIVHDGKIYSVAKGDPEKYLVDKFVKLFGYEMNVWNYNKVISDLRALGHVTDHADFIRKAGLMVPDSAVEPLKAALRADPQGTALIAKYGDEVLDKIVSSKTVGVLH